MGNIIKASEVRAKQLQNCGCLLIVANESNRVLNIVKEIYAETELNYQLSDHLIVYARELRKLRIQEEADKLIAKDKQPILIENFEMLFTPDYEINVLKYFCDLNRKRKVALKWPGKVEGDYLIYSEPGRDDYSKFKISDYDLMCIK